MSHQTAFIAKNCKVKQFTQRFLGKVFLLYTTENQKKFQDFAQCPKKLNNILTKNIEGDTIYAILGEKGFTFTKSHAKQR